MMLINGPVAQKFRDNRFARTVISLNKRLRLRSVVTGCFVHFV
jgi:hypothetical protein